MTPQEDKEKMIAVIGDSSVKLPVESVIKIIDDFDKINKKQFVLTAHPVYEGIAKSGRENRRERRKQQRKNKKR